MFKKLVSAVTAASLTVMQVIVPLTANAAALSDETGGCGNGVTYTLSDTDSNGAYDKLTISGTGSMEDSPKYWEDCKANITSVVIDDGVVYIGKNAFAGFSRLTSAEIPESVVSVGEGAFTSSGLESIIYPDLLNLSKAGINQTAAQFKYEILLPEPDGSDGTVMLIPVACITEISCPNGKQVVVPQFIQNFQVVYVDEDYRKFAAEEGHEHVLNENAENVNECQLCGTHTNGHKSSFGNIFFIQSPLEVESDSVEDILAALWEKEYIWSDFTYGIDYTLSIKPFNDDPDYDHVIEVTLTPECAKRWEIDEDNTKEYFSISVIHHHKFESAWTYDDDCHWHKCIEKDCDIDGDEWNYSDENGYDRHDYTDGICICGAFDPYYDEAIIAIDGDNPLKLSLTEQNYTRLKVRTQGGDDSEEIVWTSSNENVATVEYGVLTLLSEGETEITAEYCGKTASVTVNVIDTSAKPEVSLNVEEITVEVGRTVTVTGSYSELPDGGVFGAASSDTGKAEAELASDNSTVTITGVSVGTAEITYYYTPNGGERIAAKCTVTVVHTVHNYNDKGICTVCGEKDPNYTEPTVTDPTVTDPTVTDPTVTDPTVTDPTVTDPTVTDPTVTDPTVTDPTVTDPTVTDPTVTDPTVTKPTVTDPTVTKPTVTNPTVTNPTVYEPVVTEFDSPASPGAGNYPVVIPSGYNERDEIADIIKSTADGDIASINLKGNTMVEKEAIEAIMESGITAEINLNGGAYWTIRPSDIETAKRVDLGVRLHKNAVPKDTLTALAGDKKTTQFTLKHRGEYGFTGFLSIPIGKKYNGQFANLYYYSKGEFEFIGSAPVSKGMAVFALSHASDYVAVIDEVPYGEDVSSGDGVYASSSPIDTAEPDSNGIRLPDILNGKRLRFSSKKRRYRILKKRKLDDLVFVF